MRHLNHEGVIVTLMKKADTYVDDRWALKVQAASNVERLKSVQRRAIRRLVEAYQASPNELKKLETAPASSEKQLAYWSVDPDVWEGFVELRSHTGLTTGQLLHVATILEIKPKS